MRLISRFLLISILCSSFNALIAQSLHPILESFTLTRNTDEINANFGIIGGASCVGVELQRSIDSVNFEVVAFIPGICGGTDRTEFYSISDADPVPNVINLYRLNLGSEGKSGIVGIFYVPLESGIAIYPNPANDLINILIDNPLRKNYSLSISNTNAQIIFEAFSLNNDEIRIQTTFFSKGIHFLKVRFEDGEERQSKFLTY